MNGLAINIAIKASAMSIARLTSRYSGVGLLRLARQIGTENERICSAPAMITSPVCGTKYAERFSLFSRQPVQLEAAFDLWTALDWMVRLCVHRFMLMLPCHSPVCAAGQNHCNII